LDVPLLEALLHRARIDRERSNIIEEGYLDRLLPILARDDENELQLPALEVVFALTQDAVLRPQIVAVDGLLDSIKKLQSRGRLKQKRVAISTVQNLLGVSAVSKSTGLTSLATPAVMNPSEGEVDDQGGAEENDISSGPGGPMSPLLVGKRVPKTGGRLGVRMVAATFGETKGRPTQAVHAAGTAQQSMTMQLYVESLHNADVRQALENCLLKKDGVLSILCDLHDEKVTVRTTLGVEALQAHIWEHCRVRATTSKGDYSTFKAAGYLDERKQGSGGWLSGLASMLQIIAVKPEAPPSSSKPAPAVAQPGPGAKQQGGWLGGWW